LLNPKEVFLFLKLPHSTVHGSCYGIVEEEVGTGPTGRPSASAQTAPER
jgi:hypothetical protein